MMMHEQKVDNKNKNVRTRTSSNIDRILFDSSFSPNESRSCMSSVSKRISRASSIGRSVDSYGTAITSYNSIEEIQSEVRVAISNFQIIMILLNVVEKSRYSESGFQRAFKDVVSGGGSYPHLREVYQDFENIFKNEDYSIVDRYINFKQNFNTENIGVSDDKSVMDARDLIYEERLRLLTKGKIFENIEYYNDVQSWASALSEKLTKIVLDTNAYKTWDTDELAKIFIIMLDSITNVRVQAFDKLMDDSKNHVVADTLPVDNFMSIISSVVFDVATVVLSNKDDKDIDKFMHSLDVYAKAHIKYYALPTRTSDGINWENGVNLIKSAANILSSTITKIAEYKTYENSIPYFENLSWIKDSPLDINNEHLQMPMGGILLFIGSEITPDLIVAYDGRLQESQLVLKVDENIGDIVIIKSYSSNGDDLSSVEFPAMLNLLVSPNRTPYISDYDKYASKNALDFSRDLSMYTNKILSTGLQLIANIEKIYPGIFNSLLDLEPIRITIGDDGKLCLVAPRVFLERNRDKFLITNGKFYNKNNMQFEGLYSEFNNGEYVSLIFPLKDFMYKTIDVEPDSKNCSDPALADERVYWPKILKILGNRGLLTIEDLNEIFKPLGGVEYYKNGGKGSHYKLFIPGNEENFAIISKRMRLSGLYVLNLKSIIKSFKLKFSEFYEMLLSNL